MRYAPLSNVSESDASAVNRGATRRPAATAVRSGQFRRLLALSLLTDVVQSARYAIRTSPFNVASVSTVDSAERSIVPDKTGTAG